jgi:methionine synthase II (cobalamin-independent)
MKHLSDDTIEQMRQRFDGESSIRMNEKYKDMVRKAVQLQKNGHIPESTEGLALAKDWWDYIMEFTQGDMNMLSELNKLADSLSDSEWADKFSFDRVFLEKALGAYFTSIGYDPFKPREDDV